MVDPSEPLDERRLRNLLWAYLRPLRRAGWHDPLFLLADGEEEQRGKGWPVDTPHYDAGRRVAGATLFRTRSGPTAIVAVELAATGHLWLLPTLPTDATPEQREHIADAVAEAVSIGPDELARKDQPRRFYREHGLLP